MNTEAVPTLKPPKTGVKVRMYNVGFGDCFLLAFPRKTGRGFYMLIDCGVHGTYKNGPEILHDVVSDIASACGNHLDLVAITHEHADHISGFRSCQDLFTQIAIDDLWLAWTEDRTDPLVQRLIAQHGRSLAALQSSIRKLRGLGQAARADSLEEILGFELAAGSGDPKEKLGELEFLRSRVERKFNTREDFRRPGEPPLSLAGVTGVKVTVLGPPYSEALIGNTQGSDDLYLQAAGRSGSPSFMEALAGGSPEAEEGTDFSRGLPFDPKFRIKAAEAAAEAKNTEITAFFKQHYGFSKTDESAWRRIDEDWLSQSEELALAINEYTNNTSLVLAIELSSGKVLLFVGDAQVGNWLSWCDPPCDGVPAEVNAEGIKRLLSNTVLYKVGHHGSYNATLKTKGLERMDGQGFVAMLPVDEAWAKGKKRPWDHPDEDLYKELCGKAQQRIIRMDRIPAGKTKPPKPEAASKEAWNAFIHNLDWDKEKGLWIQYTIRD